MFSYLLLYCINTASIQAMHLDPGWFEVKLIGLNVLPHLPTVWKRNSPRTQPCSNHQTLKHMKQPTGKTPVNCPMSSSSCRLRLGLRRASKTRATVKARQYWAERSVPPASRSVWECMSPSHRLQRWWWSEPTFENFRAPFSHSYPLRRP